MIQVINDMNGGDAQKWIDKKQVYVWWIPVLPKDDKKLTIPDMKPKRTF